jgi:hypothetical protein
LTRLKRAALGAVVLGTAAIGAVYLAAFVTPERLAWAPAVFVLGIASIMVGMMVLGAASARGIGRLALPFAFVWVLLVGGFAAVFMAPAADAEGLWLGLPPAAAIIVYGIGLLPVLVLPFAYALTFDSTTLRPEDLERVRAARAAMEQRAAAGEDA